MESQSFRSRPFLVALGILAAVSSWVAFEELPLRRVVSPREAAPFPASTDRLREAYGNLPMAFEANRGQSADEVKFLARAGDYTLFLTPTEAVFSLRTMSQSGPPLRMKFAGANATPQVEGVDQQAGKTHYYRGPDPRAWQTNIPSFAKVKYAEIYPGVDLVYYGTRRALEYDLVLAPGADPNAIGLAFEGADRVELESGDLVVRASGGTVRFREPVIYQIVDGRRQRIAGAYRMGDGRRIGFDVAAYDASKPLVVDPVVEVYLTHLGGDGEELISTASDGIAADANGYAYVTGTTSSPVFPENNALSGATDVFVTKFNTTGSDLVYSVLLGSPAVDRGHDIAVDPDGNAYITGLAANGFPITAVEASQPLYAGGMSDAFMTMLDSAGTVVYSTYLGGSKNESGNGIALDPLGNVYISGETNSGPDDPGTLDIETPLPTTSPDGVPFQPSFGGLKDYFAAKFNPTLAGPDSLVYSTYLGGPDFDENFGQSIAVDAAGHAYVAWIGFDLVAPKSSAVNGFQPDCKTANTCADVIVVKLNPGGSDLVYSTHLGGVNSADITDSTEDNVVSIAVDPDGNAYVTGSTPSDMFPFMFTPVEDKTCPGPFVAKIAFDPGTSTLTLPFFTCGFGGRGIAVDAASRIYLGDAMIDLSVTDNPATTPDERIVYRNATEPGKDVAVDATCSAYSIGDTTATLNAHGPAGPFQAALSGISDAWVSKVAPRLGPFAYITNFVKGTATVIDTQTDTIADTDTTTSAIDDIDLGDGPFGVAVLPISISGGDYRVYVTNQLSNSVSVINSAHKVVETLTGFQTPTGVAVSPTANRVFVANQASGTVTILSAATNQPDTSVTPNVVDVGNGPLGVAAVQVGAKTKVFVANTASHSLSVMTIDAGVVTSIELPIALQGPSGVAIANGITTPKVFVSNGQNNTVTVVDATSHAFLETVPVGDNPQGIAASPDGSRVYVANFYPGGVSGGNSVTVIDASTNDVVPTGTVNNQIEVGGGPYGVTVHPDGTRVYVANSLTFPSWLFLAEDPGTPPGDNQGHTLSVIATALNLTVKSVDLATSTAPFPRPTAFGHFIGPVGDPGCIPLQPFMGLQSLGFILDELRFRGVESLRNPVRNALRAFERKRFDRVRHALGTFTDHVERLVRRGNLDPRTAAMLMTAVRRVLAGLPGTTWPPPLRVRRAGR